MSEDKDDVRTGSDTAHGDAAGGAPADDRSDDEKSSDELQLEWYRNVYQGDNVPQFTFRAVLMGGLLGAVMSLSNLYTIVKLGWGFGVAITACVLSFTIWSGFRKIIPGLTPMTILENNCMQSTASAAGYSTGSTIATAFGAYLLITGHQVDAAVLALWTLVTALLGVLLAVPMKRQMINKERLPFPSGIAAAETLRSLHGGSKEAIYNARSLVATLVAGVVIGIAREGDYAWQKIVNFKLPDIVPFPITLSHVKLTGFPGFGFQPSIMLIAAGMIVGMRVSASMLFSACVLYFVFGPWLINNHIIPGPHRLLSGWALWTGTGIMVAAGLTGFALQWKTILRAIGSIKKSGNNANPLAEMERVEVPAKWFFAGVIPLGIILATIEFMAFHVDLHIGILSVILAFFLALVACRATGETDITPVGAMGQISQLTFSVLKPHSPTCTLMAASATANCAIASADLLTDLKSGYLLGANARRQFLAQLSGVFFGAATVVPAWFLMIPTKEVLESYNPPSTTIWKAVAEALANGITVLPESARMGIVVGAMIGLTLTVLENAFPKIRKFLPSSMGLGLAWVMPFQNCLSFFIGALLALVWKKMHAKTADIFTIPVASGAIAGESIACALLAIQRTMVALHIFR